MWKSKFILLCSLGLVSAKKDDATTLRPSATGDLDNLDDEGKFIPMELGMREVHSEDVTRLKTSEYAPTPNVLLLSLS